MTTIAVCSSPPDLSPGSSAWSDLAAAFRRASADIALLNEMPFGPWVATAPTRDTRALDASRRAHDAGMEHLGQLGAEIVLGTRPAIEDERTVNQAFVWRRNGTTTAVHSKQFFPDEEGYYERRWFDRGRTDFRLADAGGISVGFLICTEVMFNEWARHYGRAGAHLIAVPRATPPPSTDRWRTAVRMAAIVSGCYVASSNRTGTDAGGWRYGGHGWIVDPFGDIVAETSDDQPIVTAPIDIERVRRAQAEYPCYVEELPVDRYR